MKNDAKNWEQYLASWPKGWYMDDALILVNGVPEDDVKFERKYTDVVDVTGGYIFIESERDSEPKSLTRHFAKWMKEPSFVRGLFEYSAGAEAQVIEFMRSIKAKML